MSPRARNDSRRPDVRRSEIARPRLCPEPLERRLLMAADKAPAVESVFVNGTSWAPEFSAYLEDGRDGSARFGYEADGRGDKSILPWININQITLQFSEPVDVAPGALEIDSATGEDYVVTGVVVDDATNTATFSLAEPISAADILTLRLDGAAVTDATGNTLAGGDFAKELAVLPGDANQSGQVTAEDAEGVFARFFTSTADARVDTGPDRGKYSIFFDVDGNAQILATDFAAVQDREGDSLP
jgi:hypothetical protein